MKEPVNIFVLIHGMTIELQGTDYLKNRYDPFWDALCHEQPALKSIFDKPVCVLWGHDPPHQPLTTEDHKLTKAQQFVYSKSSYKGVSKIHDSNSIMFAGPDKFLKELPVLTQLARLLLLPVKEGAFMLGFSDAIYYCSSEGEAIVRRTVYGEVLRGMDQYYDCKDVRLHVFGHSLGVTLTHDFFFGLFYSDPNYKPGFMQQGTQEDKERFDHWRTKAQNHELKFGTLISAASQLPLFFMRKPDLVNKFYNNTPLNPADIGINNKQLRWLLFYDVDDPLGFPTRGLYEPTTAIREMQVSTGLIPMHAHDNYWKNPTVIKETANLLYANSN